MATLLHETQIFSPVHCIQLYFNADVICIEQFEHYQKRSYRNRYKILTSQKVELLSIPLQKGKNCQMPVKDVKISYDDSWPLKHLHALRSAYGKSPYFDFYYLEVERILSQKYTFLFDLNMASSEFLLSSLSLSKKWAFTSDFRVVPDTEDFFLWDSLNDGGILPYPQVWSDRFSFVSGLSTLDLLFCTGPEARRYLKPSDI